MFFLEQIKCRSFLICLFVLCIPLLVFLFWPSKSDDLFCYCPKAPSLRSTKQTRLLILIFSRPANSKLRATIRSTWLAELPQNVLSYFVVGIAGFSYEVGNEIVSEQKRNQDMVVLLNLRDSPENTTLKLLHSLKFIESHHESEYILKTEDRMFVNMKSLYSELGVLPKDKLLWGFFDGQQAYNPSFFHQKTVKDWPISDRYLPYAAGGGYLFSHDVAKYLHHNHDLFSLGLGDADDTSLGSWLAPIGITRKHEPRFNTEKESRGCSNRYLITHASTPELQVLYHRNLVKDGRLCGNEEIRLRGSYVYNWRTLPSDCCHRDIASNII